MQDPAGSPAAPPPPSIFERLKKYGVDGDFENEDAALEHLANEARRARSQEGWANLGVQFQELQKQPTWQKYLASLQQASLPAGPAAAASGSAQQPAGFKWEAPEFNPEWLSLVRHDDDGNLVGVPGADPTLPGKILAWQNFLRNQSGNFFRDPLSFLKPMLDHYHGSLEKPNIESVVEQRIQQILQEREIADFSKKALDEVGSWAYQMGRDGRPVVDATGRYVMSEQGLQYYQALNELESVPPQLRHKYALAAVGRGSSPASAPAATQPQPQQPAPPQAPPPPTPQQLNDEAKARFTDRVPPGGGYMPPRAGSFNAQGQQEDDVVDETNVLQKMLADLAAQGG